MIRLEHHPSGRQLAVFGLLWLVLFGVLGGVAWWKTGALVRACVWWAVGTAVPAAGLVWPGVLRIVYVLATYASFPIGLVVSYLILAVVYYFVLTPIGIVLRLTGYDPMQRRFHRGAETYWTPREQEKTAESYFKQF
jgi:hypothetical protein